MENIKLTHKQSLFIDNYIANGGNGTKAAISAGYSKDTAAEMASENLRKPQIVKEKDRRMSEIAEKVGLTAELTLTTIKDCMKLNKKKHSASVLKACELAGKHLKLFTEKSETDVNLISHEDWLDKIK